MCGIVGAVSKRNVASLLLAGLKRLEYRGYDSAGIAVVDSHRQIQRLRSVGKVQNLFEALEKQPLQGQLGIAHTRWATHGEPSERNAHPHMLNHCAIVHNGIVENYVELRQELVKEGYICESDTDTEVMLHLYDYSIKQAGDLLTGIQQATNRLQGSFAVVLIHNQWPDRIVAVRKGCPLVLGIGVDEHYVASDQLALLPLTQRFIFLEEGDIASIQRDEYLILNATGQAVERPIHTSKERVDVSEKGAFRHYMQKEIFEQVQAIASTIEGRILKKRLLDNFLGKQSLELLRKTKNIQIIACGTSYHAGLIGRHWIEEIAGIPVQVEIASEFRYRQVATPKETLLIAISQSGETADTLAAVRKAKTMQYLGFFAICNVPGSALVRETHYTLMTRAGTEIGVASTKAFTTQLIALFLFSLLLSKEQKNLKIDEASIISDIEQLPSKVEETLKLDKQIQALAKHFSEKRHALFLGRGLQYPIALEGALKLKEISYIHAEAYPAGELKHGPLALVDKDMPVVAVAPNDDLLEKVKSNLSEVRARGGELFVFADQNAGLDNGAGTHIIEMPHVSRLLTPIIYTIPLQLLAYHVAVLKGTDVDQPRNLAKSVTVE